MAPVIYSKEAIVRLSMNNDAIVCSGTAISPHVILTASHCFPHPLLAPSKFDISINGVKTTITESVLHDGNDHALLRTNLTFEKYATFGPEPKEGDNIHYWGNPDFVNLFRRGYVVGKKGNDTLYDVNGFSGDSGAGVFDRDNRLTGVISYLTVRYSFSMMGAYAINFTPQQLQFANISTAANPHVAAIMSTGKKKTMRSDGKGGIIIDGENSKLK